MVIRVVCVQIIYSPNGSYRYRCDTTWLLFLFEFLNKTKHDTEKNKNETNEKKETISYSQLYMQNMKM